MRASRVKRRANDFQSGNRSALLQNINQAVPVCITNRKTHAWYRRQGVRISLRITPRHDDAGTRVIAMKSAYRLAHLLIGSMRYRAGVYDYQVGAEMTRGLLETLPVQTLPDRTAIGLVAATAEGADEKPRHCGLS